MTTTPLATAKNNQKGLMSAELPGKVYLKAERKPSPYPTFFPQPASQDLPKLPRMEEGWIRWRATRRLNPFIEEQAATGFEGYYVGLGLPPEKVADCIAELGAQTLFTIKTLHRHDPMYLKNLWRVAKGERYDHSLLTELNTCLMANIGRLRMQVMPETNREGDHFRTEVAKITQGEKLDYHASPNGVTEYTIPVPTHSSTQAISQPEAFFSCDKLREGYAFMQLLGRAGYPLVQLSLSK